jgi:hypothetical protein
MTFSSRSPWLMALFRWKAQGGIPRILLWSSALAGCFLCLTFLFRLFWVPSSDEIPFIQGCPGPLRLKVSPAQETKSRRIYEGLSRKSGSNPPSESLLPPLETPLLEEPEPVEHVASDSPSLSAGTPAEPLPQKAVAAQPAKNPPPTSAVGQNPVHQNPVRQTPSLDKLLAEIDAVILKKP